MKKVCLIVFGFWLASASLLSITVNVAWDRHPAPNLLGYNIYRATVSGGPYTKLNLNILPQPSGTTVPMYSDTTIPADSQLTYFYVVRAVSGGNVESANSNEVAFNAPPSPPTNLRIISFSAANLLIDGVKVASGPPYPINFLLPRQTPPRTVPIQVTVGQ